MKRITIDIEGHDVRIVAKNCAKLDEAIALKALLHRVRDEGLSPGYLSKFLGVKFAEVDNICKPGVEKWTE